MSIDFLPLNGTDHVEFYVGNAKQSAYYYRAAFGMKLVAYRGPETGTRDRASYVLQQNKIRFVLTTPLAPDSDVARHVTRHGDGVRDVALWVDDAESAWRETTKRGATSVLEPTVLEDDHGKVRVSTIAIYGDTVHSFVERSDYRGAFLPGFVAIENNDVIARPVGLRYIDHMVGNVGWGQMEAWVNMYQGQGMNVGHVPPTAMSVFVLATVKGLDKNQSIPQHEINQVWDPSGDSDFFGVGLKGVLGHPPYVHCTVEVGGGSVWPGGTPRYQVRVYP